jgi:plasmid stabilization system protein ParE
MTRYIFGRDAAEDLDQIWNYIAQDNISAADRLIKKLFDAFAELAKNPALGHTRRDLTSAAVRFWPVGNYLIIYRTASKSRIEIVGIAQGNRNIPRFLSSRKA